MNEENLKKLLQIGEHIKKQNELHRKKRKDFLLNLKKEELVIHLNNRSIESLQELFTEYLESEDYELCQSIKEALDIKNIT
jgi:hypothetical protein